MKPQSLVLAVALFIAIVSVGIIIVVPGPVKSTDHAVDITVPLPGPGRDPVVKADSDNNLEPAEQAEAKDGGIDLHEDARDETPPGVTPAQIQAGEDATNALAAKELVTPEQPGGAQNYSCKRRPVVNQSALTQRRVGVALHFTVSDPGSMNAIFGLFNRRSFGASSNYGFEPLTSKCEQWVPENRKAWAQLAANSAYVSIEIVSKDRSRASWLATPMIRNGTLAALVRDIMRRIGAPLRHVNPSGCTWTPGITDHNALECGNSHWDVGSGFPFARLMTQVRRGTSPAPLTARQRSACDKLQFHRKRAHELGSWSPARAARARELKAMVPTGRCANRYRS